MRVFVVYEDNDPLDHCIDSIWSTEIDARNRSLELDPLHNAGDIYVEQFELDSIGMIRV